MSIFKWLFYRTYTEQGGVQFYENKPVIAGDSIKWFRPITIGGWFLTDRAATKMIIQIYESQYPEYTGFFALY